MTFNADKIYYACIPVSRKRARICFKGGGVVGVKIVGFLGVYSCFMGRGSSGTFNRHSKIH